MPKRKLTFNPILSEHFLFFDNAVVMTPQLYVHILYYIIFGGRSVRKSTKRVLQVGRVRES